MPGRPFHVGVLADNVPEFSFLLVGCAFAGAVLVALNPVRRGAALARDVARTDCQFVLAEPQYAELLPVMDVPVVPRGSLEVPAEAAAIWAASSGPGSSVSPAWPPRTATFKVITRLLAAERWRAGGDPVWWRPDGRAPEFVPLEPEQAAALDAGLRA